MTPDELERLLGIVWRTLRPADRAIVAFAGGAWCLAIVVVLVR